LLAFLIVAGLVLAGLLALFMQSVSDGFSSNFRYGAFFPFIYALILICCFAGQLRSAVWRGASAQAQRARAHH
jgi:hypothetical protein